MPGGGHHRHGERAAGGLLSHHRDHCLQTRPGSLSTHLNKVYRSILVSLYLYPYICLFSLSAYLRRPLPHHRDHRLQTRPGSLSTHLNRFLSNALNVH